MAVVKNMKKKIILIGVVKYINQNIVAFYGGAVAKRVFTMKAAKPESILPVTCLIMKKKPMK